jgi:intein-encoded DNA endonuclease-like protein
LPTKISKKPIDIINLQTTKTPITPRQEEPPVWSMSPGGRKNILLSGDVLRGPRPPGKAMTEKVMVKGPGPRGEGHAPQGQEQEGRRKCLPRELRIKLYEEVKKLCRNGLTYKEILEEMLRRFGVRLSKSNVSYWIRGIHSPYNGRHIPSIEFLEPSMELAYVIGAKLGDGYATRRRRIIKGYNDVTIGLKVKDRDFAEEFGRCLEKVLRRRPIKLRYRNDVGKYVVEIYSQTLYELLKKPVDLERLKKYIEHCERCTAAFLRGFADSEGYVNKRGYIYISNTDYELLEYVRDLLQRLGIETIGPRPTSSRQGTIARFCNGNYKRRKDTYYIYIKTDSNMNFHKNIGFTIRRKQRRLENYVKKHQTRKHKRCPAKPPLLSTFLFHVYCLAF